MMLSATLDPVYHHNRNGQILEKCDVGRAAIQRTHHWSPLNEEVEFLATPRDAEMATFECAKDRHVFPWVEVNARFGFIKYSKSQEVKNGLSTQQQEEEEEHLLQSND
jgi:hypothetical protein